MENVQESFDELLLHAVFRVFLVEQREGDSGDFSACVLLRLVVLSLNRVPSDEAGLYGLQV